MITIGANFLFWLYIRVTLHLKDQVSPTCVEGDLRLCFHWGVSKAQYIDTLSWFESEHCTSEMIIICFPGWISSRIVGLQTDTDI